MLPRTERLLTDIEAWCSEKPGRQTELANALGTSRQAVWAWINRRQKPSSEQTLALIEFLQDPDKFKITAPGDAK